MGPTITLLGAPARFDRDEDALLHKRVELPDDGSAAQTRGKHDLSARLRVPLSSTDERMASLVDRWKLAPWFICGQAPAQHSSDNNPLQIVFRPWDDVRAHLEL